MGTIHKLLTQWRGKASTDDESTDGPSLPDSIGNALMEFIRIEIATACEPLTEELETAKDEAAALAEHNERLVTENNEIFKDLQRSANDKSQIIGRVQELERKLIEREEELKKMASENEELKAKIARADYHLANQENNKKTACAVLVAKLEAATETTADLRTRLEKAEALANISSTEAKTANQHYQACAAREIESLKSNQVKTATKTTPAKIAKLPKIQEQKVN